VAPTQRHSADSCWLRFPLNFCGCDSRLTGHAYSRTAAGRGLAYAACVPAIGTAKRVEFADAAGYAEVRATWLEASGRARAARLGRAGAAAEARDFLSADGVPVVVATERIPVTDTLGDRRIVATLAGVTRATGRGLLENAGFAFDAAPKSVRVNMNASAAIDGTRALPAGEIAGAIARAFDHLRVHQTRIGGRGGAFEALTAAAADRVVMIFLE
jgi:hypothetical protein